MADIFLQRSSSSPAAAPVVSAPSSPRAPSVDDFEFLLQIGRGGTATVFLVREKGTSRLYALKQAPKWEQTADLEQEQATLKMMASLPDGPRSLLSLVASWADRDYFYLLTVRSFLSTHADYRAYTCLALVRR